ncbi:MAG: hypothetical protein ACTTKO_03685 [Candidatus Limimorpha sp.]
MLKPIKDLPHNATTDNGKKFAGHKGIGIVVYFTLPCHSWKKGVDENKNGLVRQYVPKGSSLE